MKKNMALVMATMMAAASLTAVSYTHLDVYKRQVLFCGTGGGNHCLL